MKKRMTSFTVIDISEVPVLALRAKQSVRATFRLPPRSILLLSALSSQLGIKQKSLFDHLMDDVDILAGLAEQFDGLNKDEERVAKTYVISRKTLENLEAVSSHFMIPRDGLVQLSIERLMPLLISEKEKHLERKKVMKELRDYVEKGEKILTRAAKALDDDDPFLEKVAILMGGVRKNCGDMQQSLDKCSRMEEL